MRKTRLRPFVNVWVCIADFFQNFIFPVTYENKRTSHILYIWNRKCTSRSRSTIFAATPFDGKCQNLQTSFFTFTLFAMIRPVRKKVTETHRHACTYRNGQAHSYRRNLAVLPKKSFLCTLKRQNAVPKYTFSTIIIPIMSITVYFHLNECWFLPCFPLKAIYLTVA